MKVLSTFFVVVAPLLFHSCSSSGGSSQAGPAQVAVDVTPFRIDTGDRTVVTVYLSELTRDNIIVKISVPTEVTYVPDSSYIVRGQRLIDTGPTENSDGFLGYFFSESDFASNGSLELIFEVEAVSDLPLGQIEVDVDINDPDISDRIEFDTTAPQFTAQASDDIGVGPAPVATTEEE